MSQLTGYLLENTIYISLDTTTEEVIDRLVAAGLILKPIWVI